LVSGATELYRSGQKTTSDLTGAWHHFAYTWDGSTTATNAKIYFDGAELSSYDGNTNGVTLAAGTGKWSIGGRIYDDARNADGRLAEFGFWNRVMSAAEIAGLAKKYKPSALPFGLVFYAPLVQSTTDRYGKAATEDGTTVAVHLPVITPYRTLSNAVYVAPVGATIPRVMHHFRQQGIS
jgi:hypothetical protein